eukprot:761814-Hanusia_phi.AAC.1
MEMEMMIMPNLSKRRLFHFSRGYPTKPDGELVSLLASLSSFLISPFWSRITFGKQIKAHNLVVRVGDILRRSSQQLSSACLTDVKQKQAFEWTELPVDPETIISSFFLPGPSLPALSLSFPLILTPLPDVVRPNRLFYLNARLPITTGLSSRVVDVHGDQLFEHGKYGEGCGGGGGGGGGGGEGGRGVVD